jgi:DNA-binding MarR family transcriptional regulator
MMQDEVSIVKQNQNQGEQTIGRWISILYRYGQCTVARELEDYNIGRGQHVILLTLYRHTGISQETLSDILKLDKGSIAKSVKKLEDEGFIDRSVDADDKRAYKLFLTQKGQDIIPVVKKAIGDWEDALTSELKEEEKQAVSVLLEKMALKACSMKMNEEKWK